MSRNVQSGSATITRWSQTVSSQQTVIATQSKDRLTPPIPEIFFVKNVRAIVVCGFLIK